MPRIPRNFLSTTFFHVMVQGINKNYIFNKEEDIKFYIKNMYKLSEECNLKIIAYCIMNNHAHILIESKNVNSLEKYMHRLNTRYGMYYNKKNERVGYVFRDRYKAEGIYSEIQLNNCINYIYNNPVKAKICKKPWEYPYSNYKKIEIKNKDDNYIFLDINEDKEKICKEEVKKFLEENKINSETLKTNKETRRKLVEKLKIEKNISFRIISKIIDVNREKLRRDLQE